MSDEVIEELRERLARYPVDRYPVQHATTQFHLGMAHMHRGDARRAEEALARAVAGFAERLPVEQAKAKNLHGAALRALGRPDEALSRFEEAEGVFAQHALPSERAAARYNVGLALRDLGRGDAAAGAFADALRAFTDEGQWAHASAAGRELGSVLLQGGRPDAAVGVLRAAVDAGHRAGDNAALGAAANVLGLALLALEECGDAVDALRTAVVAHPRTIRPHDHAMAKANLALAYEAAADRPRARLAAQQALDVPGTPPPVAEQAAAVLRRCGPLGDDLLHVLDAEPVDRWVPIVREEVARWLDVAPARRDEAVTALLRGHLERRNAGVTLAQAWLGVLLELPPHDLDRMVQAVVTATRTFDAASQRTIRGDAGRAMVSFQPPQWVRLRDTFARIAGDVGEDERWG